MKKLKEEPTNHFSIIFLIYFIFPISCTSNLRPQEHNDSKGSTDKEITLRKKDFFACTGARDTIFASGDYLKYIPVNSGNYEIEIRINNILDTLQFFLSCKTYRGMIPKILFKSNSGSLGLEQGSSSYRYLTLCSLGAGEDKIKINKFETAVDVSAENVGLFFVMNGNLFFYNENKRDLHFKKLPHSNSGFVIKEFVLYKEKVEINYENGKSQSCLINGFLATDSVF